ncbi:hypothetical protein Tco_0378906 [Tanacetum coccineum]
MSDSEDSTVTYTAVSSPFDGLSDIGSSRVDGLPMMPEDPYAYVVAAFQAPPLPDYVPGLEEPEQEPPLPEFVPKSVYPEFMSPEDDVLPAEEQPLPAAVSPTADSPGYIADSDPKEDPEEDPTNYPADEGDDDDDDDESSNDDKDDDDDVEEDEYGEEEEEHPAPADSVPPPIHRVTARMSIREQPPTPFWSKADIARLLTTPLPPPSPLSPWSSPLPQIPLPLLPVSSPVPVSPPQLPVSPTYPLGYRAAMIRLRAETPSTSHLLPLSTPPSGTPPLLPIPLPTPLPHLLLPSIDCRAGVSEVTLPPWKMLCIALGPRYEVGESSFAPTARPSGGFRADCGFVATLDDEIRRDQREMLVIGLQTLRMRCLQDTDEIYGRLDEAQDARAVLSEARLSREAWGRSMDASDTTHSEVRALRTTVLAQQTEISALRATDRARQAQLVETLRLMSTLQT